MASADPAGPAPEPGTPAAASAGRRTPFWVALTGNPNCGKTTLFNALTGLRAKVGNYAGVTVERKEGRLIGTPSDLAVTLLDLPGTYSLSPQSLDEQVARDVLLHRLPEVPAPGLIVVVVDASNLERNLYYATQVIELGQPTVLALNMIDVAEQNGHRVDAQALAAELGVPVFPMIASTRDGVPALRDEIVAAASASGPPRPVSGLRCELPPRLRAEVADLGRALERRFPARRAQATAEALLLLTDERNLEPNAAHYGPEFVAAVRAARARLEAAGVDWRSAAIEARYTRVSAIHSATVEEEAALVETASDKLDRVFTHRVWGLAIFLALMALMFQSIFSFAQLPMQALESGVGWLGQQTARMIPPGDLQSLLVDGVVAGVGAVVVFLPQICLLFLFIGLLEDTGYMARAAFLMDRLMSKVGLHGKSFIPLLSSFACAIPGIMATRTIESPKDRLVTILVAPLMSCSARLPVYTLLIAACIPPRKVLGVFQLPGLTLLAMYLLGIGMALAMAWLFKKTLLRGEPPMLIMELPPYKRPLVRVVVRHMWDRSKLFLRRAGTVILGINILLWGLATYPRHPAVAARFDADRAAAVRTVYPDATSPAALAQGLEALRTRPLASPLAKHPAAPQAAERIAAADRAEVGERLRTSFAGRLGHLIEPLIAPLGFDWKMGIGIVASFAAREVFVSTMSVVYNVGGADDAHGAPGLAEVLRAQQRPDGTPVYTTLTAVTLMVFYVLAMQCVSTMVIVRRETNTWKWSLFQYAYMGALAWIMAFLTYQGGRWLGLG